MASRCSLFLHFLELALHIDNIALSLGSACLHRHRSAFVEAKGGFTKVLLRKKAIVVNIVSFIFCSAWFWIADQGLIFCALTERCVFRTESWETIGCLLDLNPFRSPGVKGDCIDGCYGNGLDVVSWGFGDFVQVEVDRHHVVIVGMGVIGQFLVEVLIIKFLSSFIQDYIDCVGGWMNCIVSLHG